MQIHNAILITGGAQRIGLYLAEQFIAQNKFPVIFTYRTHHQTVSKLESLGAVALQVDFQNENSIKKFELQLLKIAKSLRCVIHNASVWHKENNTGLNSNLLDELLNLHVKTPYRLNYMCQALLNNSDFGMTDIIAMTDTNISNGKIDQIAYLASKAGLSSMCISFALAFAPSIKINEIAPGLVIFNDDDTEDYRKERLSQMTIPLEPKAEVIWQTVQFIMNLPNTTGQKFKI
jgi:dihydromonapterin reductase/dihydrofolate reductase